MLLTKPGVLFATIAPAGFRLLSALDQVSIDLQRDVVITSGTDGEHSGPGDPHHLGEAYDVRSSNFLNADEKVRFIKLVLMSTHDSELVEKDGGWVNDYFFGWLEDAGTANEHFHFQARRGLTLPA